jgi:HK97 family phage prohead protease
MAKNKQRQFRMEVKELGEDGSFEGVLSPYNNVDEGGDVVEPGAFTKTLQENGNKIPALWQHMTDCPIGDLTLEDKEDGLHCKGQLLLEIPEAKKAYILLKAKIVRGLSIGYDTIKAQVIDGVRHLKEIRLWEGSIVTFPMNTLALVASVKSRQVKGDFNEELTERQLWDAGYQIICALQNALGCIPWTPELSRDEMVSAAETVLQQFHDAFMEYFPQYLDLLTEAYGLDIKAWAAKHETKEGRTLSAATKSALSDCHGHVKSAFDLLEALLGEEAGDNSEPGDDSEDATSKAAAATEQKSEPEDLHSAAESIASMRALLRA